MSKDYDTHAMQCGSGTIHTLSQSRTVHPRQTATKYAVLMVYISLLHCKFPELYFPLCS